MAKARGSRKARAVNHDSRANREWQQKEWGMAKTQNERTQPKGIDFMIIRVQTHEIVATDREKYQQAAGKSSSEVGKKGIPALLLSRRNIMVMSDWNAQAGEKRRRGTFPSLAKKNDAFWDGRS